MRLLKWYDLEVYFEVYIQYDCEPHQKFDFLENEVSFRFILFENFTSVCYSPPMWGDAGWSLLLVFCFIWS